MNNQSINNILERIKIIDDLIEQSEQLKKKLAEIKMKMEKEQWELNQRKKK